MGLGWPHCGHSGCACDFIWSCYIPRSRCAASSKWYSSRIWCWPGLGLQIVVITVVTLLAVVSVVRGIDGGVKVISNINMVVAFLLLLLVGLIGWAASLGSIPTTLMAYVENIIPLSSPFGRTDEAWFQGWTVFYWAWWISWSPFVGMFIARVSRGRTVREFITAVLLVPTAVTVVWMSVFGGLAISKLLIK